MGKLRHTRRGRRSHREGRREPPDKGTNYYKTMGTLFFGAGDDLMKSIEAYNALGRQLDLFAERKARTKEAQGVLEGNLPPIYEVFLDEETRGMVQPLFLANEESLMLHVREELEVLKRKLRVIIGEAMKQYPEWYRGRLEAYGIGGALIRFLSQDRPFLVLVQSKWGRVVSLDDMPEQIWASEDPHEIAMIVECAFFEIARWRLRRCQRGQHWYFGHHWRQEECLAHRRAGQTARYRARKKQK